jgi:predicted Zn-dependent protease
MKLLLVGLLALLSACAPQPTPSGGRTVLDSAADAAEVPVAAAPAARPPPPAPDRVAMVFAQTGRLKDPPLEEFVAQLGQKLAQYAPPTALRYRFLLVDQWSPNAFTLPGGEIFVSRGLLVLSNSEDELAGVLSHEIVHAAARHALGREAYVEALSPFSLGLPRAASIAAYGRDQERTADMEGQRIAARAGYDPAGLPDFLKSLGKVERLMMGGTSRMPNFLDTHPGTSERVTAAVVLASTIAPPSADRGKPALRGAYLERLAGLVLGSDPAEGVVRGNVFLHPDLDIAVSFPSGTNLQNTPLAVVAVTQNGDARFALEDGGPGDDPEVVARAWLAQRMPGARGHIQFADAQQTLCCKTYVVRGSSETPQGLLAGQLAWVALHGRVYLLSAVSAPFAAKQTWERARQMVRSVRALSAADRASIEVERLRVVRANAGETLAELSARTANTYDVHRTAIANDLEVTSRLSEGQLVKIGVREPYQSGEQGGAAE